MYILALRVWLEIASSRWAPWQLYELLIPQECCLCFHPRRPRKIVPLLNALVRTKVGIVLLFKVMFCRVRLFVYPWYLPGSYPYTTSFVCFVHHTLPDKFYEFCRTFIPLPDSSVSSVIIHTFVRRFCEFCTNFVLYPGMRYTFVEKSGGSLWVLYNTGLCPVGYAFGIPEYLPGYCKFCKALYPTR